MASAIFIILLFSVSAVLASNEKKVVCYYGTWATYRWGTGKMDVEDINPELCTHLVYTFAGINAVGTVVSLDPNLDLPGNRDNFRRFTALKNVNPKLKTILAVGGWSEGSAKYSIMAANPIFRQNFIQSALKMVQDHNFDGFDVDWEYPNKRDTVHGWADIDNFTQLLKELKEEFEKYGLLVTIAVSAVEPMASISYNVRELSKYVDYVSLMTYDLYGAWDPVTGHNAPLHKGEGDEGVDASSLFTIDMAIDYWLRSGCPPEKLIVGVPFYGRTFTLTSASQNTVRSPARGVGIAGQFTVTNGFIGYNEFCVRLQTEPWTVRVDEKAKVPYAVNNLDWVSYDDAAAIAAKVEYALSLNLGGIMVWSIETDDFHGLCGHGDNPLLRAINKGLSRATDSSAATTPAPKVSSSTESTSAPSSSTTQSSSTLTTTSAPSSSTTQSTSTSTSTSAPSSSTAAPSDGFVCTEEGFASNPTDCSTYFMCVKLKDSSFVSHKFLCPNSLYWDQTNSHCNYPQYTICNV